MTSVLVTGGTGSFGQAFTRHLLATDTERVVVFSRDEVKQHQMRQDGFTDPRLRWFIGDVRDRDRLRRAMKDIDTVVHAAALKQVDSCEFNPLEAVKTNVDGTANVINAALDANVKQVLMLGTDKAVDPTNLYGATKLVAEKLIVDANVYSGADGTRFAATRYGNVISSRGSVLPVFQAQQRALDEMLGGEVFVPKLPAVTVNTIALAAGAGVNVLMTGRRPGEKQHEALLSEHEAHRAIDAGWCYLVKPIHDLGRAWKGDPVPAGFKFTSDTAEQLDVDEFRVLAGLSEGLRLSA